MPRFFMLMLVFAQGWAKQTDCSDGGDACPMKVNSLLQRKNAPAVKFDPMSGMGGGSGYGGMADPMSGMGGGSGYGGGMADPMSGMGGGSGYGGSGNGGFFSGYGGYGSGAGVTCPEGQHSDNGMDCVCDADHMPPLNGACGGSSGYGSGNGGFSSGYGGSAYGSDDMPSAECVECAVALPACMRFINNPEDADEACQAAAMSACEACQSAYYYYDDGSVYGSDDRMPYGGSAYGSGNGGFFSGYGLRLLRSSRVVARGPRSV